MRVHSRGYADSARRSKGTGPLEIAVAERAGDVAEITISAGGSLLGTHRAARTRPEPIAAWLIEPHGPALVAIGEPSSFETYLVDETITSVPDLDLRF